MSLFKNVLPSIIFFTFISVLKAEEEKPLLDGILDNNIKSVQFYQKTDGFNEQITFPVVSLHSQGVLQLDFDELTDHYNSFYFKIILCNLDWTPAVLLESEYLKEFLNDNLITTYNLSFNTKVKYTHYSLRVPKLKISGNYIVQVYRGSNTENVVLNKRFIVFDSKLQVNPAVKPSVTVEERFTHQQVDFTIDYGVYPSVLYNPMDEIKVIIRQNGRWDNMIQNLKPLYFRDGENLLDYSYFNNENAFAGGNEFRQFDCRRIRTLGINIEYIDNSGPINTVKLIEEKSRANKPYAFYFDANGMFIIGNNEIGGNLTDADYVNVEFNLKLSQMPMGNIYIIGKFNDYKYLEENKLTYDAQTESYKGKIFVKQGYYNYIYAVKNQVEKTGNETDIEGSFYQTENFYEIIVYHKPMGERVESVVGYSLIKHNQYR